MTSLHDSIEPLCGMSAADHIHAALVNLMNDGTAKAPTIDDFAAEVCDVLANRAGRGLVCDELRGIAAELRGAAPSPSENI